MDNLGRLLVALANRLGEQWGLGRAGHQPQAHDLCLSFRYRFSELLADHHYDSHHLSRPASGPQGQYSVTRAQLSPHHVSHPLQRCLFYAVITLIFRRIIQIY